MSGARPHKGVLIAVAAVLPRPAAPAVVAAVDAGCEIASSGACLRAAAHLVHVAACDVVSMCEGVILHPSGMKRADCKANDG